MRPITKEQRLERLVDTAKLLAINLRNATDYLSELKRDAEALLDEHRDELRAIEEAEAATVDRIGAELGKPKFFYDRLVRMPEPRFDDEPVTLDDSVLRGVAP